jgi:predicted phosphoadenosine phosphosulfate sulfurtransferase
MKRKRLKPGYLDKDVLTAAKERIHHLFDINDIVVSNFSGGKDSLALLHLVKEVAEERGEKKVNALFWDEEVIPDTVINFVESYRTLPWMNMIYLTIPLKSTKYILGKTYDYIQWDPARPHVRPMPPHGVRMPPGDTTILDQYSINEMVANLLSPDLGARVTFLNGMRASESINRLRASLCKEKDNYISKSKSPRISLCKPLYDWQENDIFRYFFDRKINYCPIYDHQVMAGMALRVATPLHAETAKRIGKYREVDPEYYNRILKVFPEMEVQERYYHELDRDGLRARYGQSMEGVKSYIMENFSGEDGQLELALQRWEQIGRSDENYPVAHVLNYFIGGAIKRMLVPLYLRFQT